MFDSLYQFIEKLGYTHPLHPTQVNMPIGLVVAAFVLLLVALLIRGNSLARCARYCMAAALLFLVPTIIAGFMDWQHYYSGGWIFPIRLKMGLAVILVVLLLTAFFMGRKSEGPTFPLLVVYGLCLATVVALGYLGAELVFAKRAPPTDPEFSGGRVLFHAHCSGCHPYGSNIVDAEYILWDNLRLAKVEYLRGWLRKPEKPMPVFSPECLSDTQVQELFGYLNRVFYQKILPSSEDQKKPQEK
jgi:uncharacterized membrane protein